MSYLSNVKDRYVEKDSFLYRFVNKKPSDVNINKMWNNCGKDGRFNKYRNIYYCCNDISTIPIENITENSRLEGSLIKAIVKEPLKLGQVIGEELFRELSGLTLKEKDYLKTNYPDLYMLKQSLNLTEDVDYTKTSEMAEQIFKYYPNGIAIPSVIGFPNGLYGFCISDENKLTTENYALNFALTKQGYEKIQEYKPIIYRQ